MERPPQSSRYCTDPQAVAASVADNIRHHGLLDGVSHLGLAVSGGADSVALFHLMLPLCHDAGIRLSVLHVDHGLRHDSREDDAFVRHLAKQAGLPCLTRQADIPSFKASGRSVEMTARDARMAFFKECAATAGLDAIATGHQADDVAETLLLRLTRGSGATGLSGLRPRSDNGSCRLIRPLLTVSARALRTWLTSSNRVWREDTTNRDTSIPRNLIRNTLLPALEQCGYPDLRPRLCQSAEALREDDLLLEALAAKHLSLLYSDPLLDEKTLPLEPFLAQPPALQRRIMRQWLFRNAQDQSAGLDTVSDLIERCQTLGDWKRQLPGDTRAVCHAGQLSLLPDAPPPAPPPDADLPAAPNTPLRWGNLEITVTPDIGIHSVANGIGSYPATCSLDAATLRDATLQIRARRPGDRIAPTGHSGTKKIHDLFIDAKIPQHLRDTLPLLACGDNIIWVPGYRIDRRFAVPSADAPCLRVTLTSIPPPSR